MKKLVLLRHWESQWNKENRFTWWTDVDLSEKWVEEAIKAWKLLKEQNIQFKRAFTSYLKRAVKTLNVVLDQMDLDWIPVEKTWRLNKKETAEKYGDEQVLIWRRSFDVPPTPLDKDDERSPFQDPRYADVPENEVPLTESLKECIQRLIPCWENQILPALKKEETILVAAHGNNLRWIVKLLKNISDENIVSLNLPTAVPYVFEFDDDMNLAKDYFLWNPEEIKKLMEAVANQGKK